MPQVVYINGTTHRLKPSSIIGQGGEAAVYQLDKSTVVKVYLEPSDPQYAGNPSAQVAARQRLDEHCLKLPAFPQGLPSQVVAPVDLAYARPGGRQVAGYTMPFLSGMEVLLSYSDGDFRRANTGIDGNMVVGIFRNLHQLVRGVHSKKVVIGDFNDLNVLVSPQGVAHIVDADSMQFGSFYGHTFTGRFVDPLHVRENPKADSPSKLLLARPHTELTDWYAFTTMLFQVLTYIHPFYGGVHKPKGGSKQYRLDSRVLHRVSVFSPDVKLPKAAVPLSSLPDELLEFFRRLYERDARGEFPIKLLENMRWTTCAACGLAHARGICPACAAPGAVTQRLTVRGTVTATRLFETSGQILFATAQGGKLRYVYHENGAYWREEGVRVLSGDLDGKLRVRIWKGRTVFAKGSSVVALGGEERVTHVTETFGRLPIMAANEHHLYWIENAQLVHDGPHRPVSIGNILSNRTLVWVGSHFGFGFYRAGALTRGFVFDAKRPGMNDSVPLPSMLGNLIDATCTFARDLAWFMITIEESGVIRHHCYVINNKAQLLATAEATAGDGTWLGEGIRGHLATGGRLFVATDTGIVRVEIDGSGLAVTHEYPDTEPFVSTASQLLMAEGGIVAVSHREITLLQMK